MELTGINIDYVVPSSTDAEAVEKGIMLSERNFTDIIGFSATEVVQMNADDVIIALDDVIDQYMPNYKAYLEANPDIEKLIRSDDGHIYYVPMVMEDASMGNTYGVYCRQDWLDEMGVKMPETIDEWYTLLTRIKNEKGVTPIMSTANYLTSYGAFMNAFVPERMGGDYYVEDGKVVFIPAMDGMREYLTVLNKWFEEGLIHPDAGTNISSSIIRGNMANGNAFLALGNAGSGIQRVTNEAAKSNLTIELTAVATPSAKPGEKPKYQSASPVMAANTGGACISTTCKNVEAAARYLDFHWTEEGFLLKNFGIEGTSYTVVDGVETYTDLILKNPDGLTIDEAMAGYMEKNAIGLQAKNYLKGYYSSTPAAAAAPEIWASKGEIDFSMRMISHTTEESDTLALYSELTTYVAQSFVQFVIGVMDIETQWDEYMNNLKAFGMEECLKVKQAAYDRYAAK